MKFIRLFNLFWRMNKERQFTSAEVHLFFKLVDTCNLLGWKKSFSQSNRFLIGETGMCERTLINSRNKLVAAGLIEYHSAKAKRDQGTYIILNLEDPDDSVNAAAEKENSRKAPAMSVTHNAAKREWKMPTPDQLRLPICPERNNTSDFLKDEGDDSFREADVQKKDIVNDNKKGNGFAGNAEEIADNSPANVGQLSENCPTNVQQMSQKSTDNITPDKDNDNNNNKEKKSKRKKKVSEEEKASSLTAEMRLKCNEVFDSYNEICKNLPKAISLSDARISLISNRLTDYSMEIVKKMLGGAARSEFLSGKNERGWKANIDWLFNPNNFLKVVEGYYDFKSKVSFKDQAHNHQKPSAISVLKRAYQNIIDTDDDFRQR